MARARFCVHCGAVLGRSRSRCPRCGRIGGIADVWWYALAGILGVAAGLWQLYLGTGRGWIALAVLGTWMATALAFRLLLESSPPPLASGQGRRTWKIDWLFGVLLLQATIFGLVRLEMLSAGDVLIFLVVLPLVLSAPIAIVRRMGGLSRPGGGAASALVACPDCEYLSSPRAQHCWNCGGNLSPD